MWSLSQRAVVLILTIGIFVSLVIRLSRQPVYVSDPPAAQGPRAGELADRFDPNRATAAELASIPYVGENLAGAIVEYRDRHALDHPGRLVFLQPDDLMKVRGVGRAKMETLCEYLEFPAVHR